MAKAVIQANIQTSSGSIYVAPSASIEIRDAGTGALVQLWTDRDGSIPQVNPFNADVNGDFKVYATEGRVNISATYGGNTKTWNDVVVFESTKAVELSLKVDRTDATAGSAVFPSRTTTERDLDTPQTGYFGYNETTNKFEGYGSAGWSSLVDPSNIQKQDFVAFTTGGTSTAYTLTTSPALPALTTNESFRVTFHTASGAAPTIARDGLTAKPLKQYDSAGDKVTAAVASGQISDVVYDGTDYVVLNRMVRDVGRNLIINANFEYPVNQKGIASRVTTTGTYNFDQWYYGSDTKLYQPIEFINLSASQVYVLNWEGTATCEYKFATVGSSGIVADVGAWTAISKKGTLAAPSDVITGSKFLWLRWTSVTSALATFDKPQLEDGTSATKFERKTYAQSLIECQRYLFKHAASGRCIGQADTTTRGVIPIQHPITMRTSGSSTVTLDTATNYQVTSAAGVAITGLSVANIASDEFATSIAVSVSGGGTLLTVGQATLLISGTTIISKGI